MASASASGAGDEWSDDGSADGPAVSCGLQLCCVPDLVQELSSAVSKGFEFVVVPGFHPSFERDARGVSDSRPGCLTRSDMVMPGSRWSTSAVVSVSDWIDLDSPVESVRLASEAALEQELRWGAHLGVPAVMLPAPKSANCFNYARKILSVLKSNSYIHVWVRIPLVAPATPSGIAGLEPTALAGPQQKAAAAAGASGAGAPGACVDSWLMWNNIRRLCNHHPNLSVCLVLGRQMPATEALAVDRHGRARPGAAAHVEAIAPLFKQTVPAVRVSGVERWLAEPVKSCVVPTSLMEPAPGGGLQLPPAHALAVQHLYRHKVQFVLQGRAPGPAARAHVAHLEAVEAACAGARDPVDRHDDKHDFESPYYDYLQSPLQPLMDNLESGTYETFEKDPIKYQQYEVAIRRALLDRPADSETVLMVVGAGRGPLVRRALAASRDSGRRIRVYAVEKNPNAVITLRNLKATSGWTDEQVTIVSGDMRRWEAPEQADILVSELLGSFGDNELSPECLDGAQRFLKPEGISIPAEYTSFLSPVSTSKLWNELRSSGEDPKDFETSYVVRFHAHKTLAPAQPCHQFHHPNRADRIDNERYSVLRFKADDTALVHGFAGYFHCVLYKDVTISICPDTHSDGMFSWFPIFFPIRLPFEVKRGDDVEVHVWRKVGQGKVWYEWAFTAPVQTAVHNPNGRSHWIGL